MEERKKVKEEIIDNRFFLLILVSNQRLIHNQPVLLSKIVNFIQLWLLLAFIIFFTHLSFFSSAFAVSFIKTFCLLAIHLTSTYLSTFYDHKMPFSGDPGTIALHVNVPSKMINLRLVLYVRLFKIKRRLSDALMVEIDDLLAITLGFS